MLRPSMSVTKISLIRGKPSKAQPCRNRAVQRKHKTPVLHSSGHPETADCAAGGTPNQPGSLRSLCNLVRSCRGLQTDHAQLRDRPTEDRAETACKAIRYAITSMGYATYMMRRDLWYHNKRNRPDADGERAANQMLSIKDPRMNVAQRTL